MIHFEPLQFVTLLAIVAISSRVCLGDNRYDIDNNFDIDNSDIGGATSDNEKADLLKTIFSGGATSAPSISSLKSQLREVERDIGRNRVGMMTTIRQLNQLQNEIEPDDFDDFLEKTNELTALNEQYMVRWYQALDKEAEIKEQLRQLCSSKFLKRGFAMHWNRATCY